MAAADAAPPDTRTNEQRYWDYVLGDQAEQVRQEKVAQCNAKDGWVENTELRKARHMAVFHPPAMSQGAAPSAAGAAPPS